MRAPNALFAPLPKRNTLLRHLSQNRWMYLFLLPGFLYLILFQYVPMYGVLIAFKKFTITKGFLNSPWVGLENFRTLFRSAQFMNVLRNSIVISLLNLAWGFPAPILMALLLNEVRQSAVKRTVQTIVYLPHFVSWVVIAGMVVNILSPAGGLVNEAIKALGGSPINFIIDTRYFRSVLISSSIWKECGWGTIIYLAAMSGIDPALYEAAIVDGASRGQQVRYITLPCILSTIIVVLILRMGSILSNGFEQIYLLYSPTVYDVADVFETFTYRVGLLEGRFSYSTAVGLFQSVVGFIMIFSTNRFARALGETGLW